MIAEDNGVVDEDGVPTMICKDIFAGGMGACGDDDNRGSVDRLAARKRTLTTPLSTLLQQAVDYSDELRRILRI